MADSYYDDSTELSQNTLILSERKRLLDPQLTIWGDELVTNSFHALSFNMSGSSTEKGCSDRRKIIGECILGLAACDLVFVQEMPWQIGHNLNPATRHLHHEVHGRNFHTIGTKEASIIFDSNKFNLIHEFDTQFMITQLETTQEQKLMDIFDQIFDDFPAPADGPAVSNFDLLAQLDNCKRLRYSKVIAIFRRFTAAKLELRQHPITHFPEGTNKPDESSEYSPKNSEIITVGASTGKVITVFSYHGPYICSNQNKLNILEAMKRIFSYYCDYQTPSCTCALNTNFDYGILAGDFNFDIRESLDPSPPTHYHSIRRGNRCIDWILPSSITLFSTPVSALNIVIEGNSDNDFYLEEYEFIELREEDRLLQEVLSRVNQNFEWLKTFPLASIYDHDPMKVSFSLS